MLLSYVLHVTRHNAQQTHTLALAAGTRRPSGRYTRRAVKLASPHPSPLSLGLSSQSATACKTSRPGFSVERRCCLWLPIRRDCPAVSRWAPPDAGQIVRCLLTLGRWKRETRYEHRCDSGKYRAHYHSTIVPLCDEKALEHWSQKDALPLG